MRSLADNGRVQHLDSQSPVGGGDWLGCQVLFSADIVKQNIALLRRSWPLWSVGEEQSAVAR